MDAAVATEENGGTEEGPWELPVGWCWTKLGKVLPIAYGKALPDRDRTPDGEFAVFGSSGPVGSHDVCIAPAHSVMVGRKGSAGSVFYSEKPSWPIDTAYFTSGTAAIDIRYGYWFLWFRKLGKLDQSTAIPSLSRDIYNVQPIPLAPLAEQRRIVARIDALFAEIAEGEAALEAARKGLDAFRRALLKAAVTGELTKDWRAANPVTEVGHNLVARLARGRIDETIIKGRGGRSVDVVPLDTTSLPALPDNWAWATVRDVGNVQLGRQRAPQHHTGENMRPYLRVANVFEDRIDFSDVKEMNFTPDEFKTFELKPGDILLNEGQTPDFLGRPAMWRSEFKGYCFQNTLLRFKTREPMNAEFCLLVFRHYLHAKRFKKESQITTNIAHLSSGRFVTIEFPVPPLEEQAEIVRRVSEGLAGAADTLVMLDAEAADAARLKQSILKAAFEGRIVPQDPTDEPSSALLARLAANPSAVPAKRGRARKSVS